MKALLDLKKAGQSYWLDNLTRDMILNGELKKRVTEQGLRGVTSNPAIFNKAISKSDLYDEQIRELALNNASTAAIYEALVVQDVQAACDILRPVYDESDGEDGYVSLEVSPHLAHDTDGTMNEVRYLFERVNRPNVLMKIPGTEEGVPAIERLLFEGININITLLFSIEAYEEVAKAYINALEDRIAHKQPIDKIASVASFFVSRIDVLVDLLLSHRVLTDNRPFNGVIAQDLMGKAAIANAKFAYQKYRRFFHGKKWEKLAKQGAKLQRLLWASTSTKNPQYSDVMYVEPLIGRDTVNTMPEDTIHAFSDHGIVQPNAIEKNSDKAGQIFKDLHKIGIDMNFVTRQLVNEGIQKFIDPYDQLLKTIDAKRQQFLAEKNTEYHQKW